MKINYFFKIFICIYILIFCKLSYAFDESVAAKYNDIFTKNTEVVTTDTGAAAPDYMSCPHGFRRSIPDLVVAD